MQTHTAKLIEIFNIGEERAGVFDLPTKLWPSPGQYLPCQKIQTEPDVLPSALFPLISPPDSLALGPIPDSWVPGDRITYLPPQGNGYALPPTARRVGLLTLTLSPAQVLTLAHPALAQDAAVTLFFDAHEDKNILLNHVPSAVEIVPISALPETLSWLDFLAIEVTIPDLTHLSALLPSSHLTFEGQIRVRTAMPCRGLGDCGVCGIRTHHGWRMVCSDGPVFPLQEVLHVAG
jgi:dihydroorotate dehydrogenase electron transfer subunit